MSSVKAILIVLINIFIFKIVSAQVTGKVTTQASQVLQGATVFLLDSNNAELQKIITDDKGIFQLHITGSRAYLLQVSYTGFKTYRSDKFFTTKKDFGTITLISIDSSLKEVVVEAKKNVLEQDGTTLIYNVAKSIDAQGTSAFEALKKAPGVFIENESIISLNGKTGTIVLLDGKQTYLSGKELVDLLKSMPSSGIRSIELIANPTAKYDASGAAGIINIRTSKNPVKGFNGTANAGFAYGVYLRQNSDVSFNYRRNKINIFGGYNHFIGYYSYLYGNDRLQQGKTYNSFTDDVDKRKRMGVRAGVDYNINKLNTIGLLVNNNFIFGGGITDTRTEIYIPSSPNVHQLLDAVNDYYFQQTERYNFNLNYKYEDSIGRIINVDADYGFFNKGNANLQSNIYTNNQQQITTHNLYRILNDIDIDLKAFKVDYISNLGKGKLELGAKYSDIYAHNDSRFFHALQIKDSLDARRSNIFNFNEKITSGYISYKQTWRKWSVQGGVRVESSASNGGMHFKFGLQDSTENINRQNTNLFPSFSLSFKPKAQHIFSFAYSRRIDRPAYQDLNPFIYLLDELSFWQGNPFLQPQLTHRSTIQYIYKNTTVIGFSYSYTDRFSARINDTIDGQKIMMIQKNVGVQKNLSLTLTQTYQPVKGWDVTLNGVIYHLHNKVSLDKYRSFNLKQMAGRVNLQQTFQLPYKFTGELTATYNSKRLTGANDISRHTSGIDIGLQKKVLKEKGTLRLVVNDIYQGSRSNSLQSYRDFYLRSYGYYETRQVRLNFTYRFADSSVKGPRSRSSALDNENSRIK